MKLQLSMVSACLLFQSTSFAQPISVHTEKDGIKIDATIDASKFQVGDSIVLIIEAMSDDKTKLTITETHSYGSFMIQQDRKSVV